MRTRHSASTSSGSATRNLGLRPPAGSSIMMSDASSPSLDRIPAILPWSS